MDVSAQSKSTKGRRLALDSAACRSLALAAQAPDGGGEGARRSSQKLRRGHRWPVTGEAMPRVAGVQKTVTRRNQRRGGAGGPRSRQDDGEGQGAPAPAGGDKETDAAVHGRGGGAVLWTGRAAAALWCSADGGGAGRRRGIKRREERCEKEREGGRTRGRWGRAEALWRRRERGSVEVARAPRVSAGWAAGSLGPNGPQEAQVARLGSLSLPLLIYFFISRFNK